MIKDQEFLEKIVEGAQEKKAKKIVLVDMSELEDAPCSHFVICEGDSGVQVNAIAQSITNYVRTNAGIKPFASDGYENSQWIALDYGHIIVHVFQRPFREFYDLEHLWLDAKLEVIPDVE